MRLGTVANLAPATVQAIAAPVAAARVYVPAQTTAYLDDTGGRAGPQRAWLWTAVSIGVTVVVVRRSRSGKVAQALLGERWWGWLVTNRWPAYLWYPPWRRLVCCAHLWRAIAAMRERGGPSPAFGEALQVQMCQMFHGGQRVRDGTLAPARFASDMRPIQREIERWLEAGQVCGVPKTEGTCREILKRRQAVWTCVRHAGVELTNNAAEVRSVDQKPSGTLGGLVRRRTGRNSCQPENSCRVSVQCRSPLVRG
jgi:transposase